MALVLGVARDGSDGDAGAVSFSASSFILPFSSSLFAVGESEMLHVRNPPESAIVTISPGRTGRREGDGDEPAFWRHTAANSLGSRVNVTLGQEEEEEEVPDACAVVFFSFSPSCRGGFRMYGPDSTEEDKDGERKEVVMVIQSP